jgi:iron-sulfur cluster repair protein YtfE (RIC family)
MRSLPKTSQDHNETIRLHVARLPALAEMIDRASPAEFAAALEPEYAFISEQLLPHMATIERSLYGELERLMGARHSMSPMRQEHETVRRLIELLGDYRRQVTDGGLGDADAMGLRRVLYRLYSILQVHLAEEELYLRVLDHNLSDEEKDVLAGAIDHACSEPV